MYNRGQIIYPWFLVTRPPRFLFCSKKESKAAGKQSRHKGSKMRRKCVGNKVAGVFSCGQRDLCHLSETQPQAGNRTKYAVKYGIVKSRNNTSRAIEVTVTVP